LNDSLHSPDPGAQKRRSTRIIQAIPITVTGTDALGQQFKERTTTVMVNCHGCKYQSKHYVPKNSMVTLDIPRAEGGTLNTQGVVVWVQRPRTVRELFQIGVEFEAPGNVWGIAFPPADWAADGQEPAAEVSNRMEVAAIEVSSVSPQPLPPILPPPMPPMPEKRTETPVSASESRPPANDAPVPPPSQVGESQQAVAASPSTASAENRIHVVPDLPADEQIALSRQVARMLTEAKESLDQTVRKGAEEAITEEMTVARLQLDAQLHDTVEKAIKASMDRVSESALSKVMQETAERTTAIVEEARRATETSASQLDEKVRRAVQEAVNHAAEQAALQAAQQTAALDLKQSVEEAIERVLRNRETTNPSLEILASPEAARNHLEQWRTNLEQTAQTVRAKTLEQAQTEATTAAQQWNAEFETALGNASRRLGDKLSEVSRTALTQAEQDTAARIESLQTSLNEASGAALTKAEQDATARAQTLKTSLDEAISSAASTIESLGSGLQQERHRAEETQSHLAESVQSAIRQARQQLDELLDGQQHEIARKADEVIGDRVNQIEPALQASAQKILESASGALEQIIKPQIDQAHRVVSELKQAEAQVNEARHRVREQMQDGAEEVTRLQDTLHNQVHQASEQVARLQDAVHLQVQQASHRAAELQDEVNAQLRLATERTGQLQEKIREQTAHASDLVIQESVARIREEAGKVPTEIEQSCRTAAAKIEEELQQRSTETQHQTYEALQKAAEWYQKKAHNTMNSSLEKAVEQSSTLLRDRAAEVSSLLASELDHYRRTYIEHSTAQIEESAKEIVGRQRDTLSESSQMATAGFSDQIHRVTSESLRRFEQASREALEKARGDLEFSREGSLAEYHKRLDERMAHELEQAGVRLKSQLVPLMEAWEARRESERTDWMAQLKKVNEESIEAYKMRLENASNSWLLASATTLGQHSQTVLETIAKAAEKRLRETCAAVLGSMGDTLKARLLGLSSDFNAQGQEDEEFPPKNRQDR
jgi:hypothetical protein